MIRTDDQSMKLVKKKAKKEPLLFALQRRSLYNTNANQSLNKRLSTN